MDTEVEVITELDGLTPRQLQEEADRLNRLLHSGVHPHDTENMACRMRLRAVRWHLAVHNERESVCADE